MSINPGTTSFPRASIDCAEDGESEAMLRPTAAMRPALTATSNTPSRFRPGSMTRPPRIVRSYSAPERRRMLANPPMAAALRSFRRGIRSVFRGFLHLIDHQDPDLQSGRVDLQAQLLLGRRVKVRRAVGFVDGRRGVRVWNRGPQLSGVHTSEKS